MTLEELMAKYKAILEKAKTENRSLSSAETGELDTLKAEIAKAEQKQAAGAEIAKREEELRSIAAAQSLIKDKLGTVDKNTYLRSIAKGANDVGNKEVIADVVRAFESESPVFKVHGNIQRRSTGMAFSFTKVTVGSTAGYAKTEGNAATEDGSGGGGATASAIVPVAVTFKTYTSQKIPVTQEMLDDAAADISQEVMTLGMAKSTSAFDSDAIDALESAVATPTPMTGASLAVSDLVAAYLSIPNRNRRGVKYFGDAAACADLINLLTVDKSPALAVIGLTAENIVVDDNCTGATITLANPTLALAIGMKEPVRIFTQETSAGRDYEVQPRLAVALRDATAVAAIDISVSTPG